jgi:hypothetical protein
MLHMWLTPLDTSAHAPKPTHPEGRTHRPRSTSCVASTLVCHTLKEWYHYQVPANCIGCMPQFESHGPCTKTRTSEVGPQLPNCVCRPPSAAWVWGWSVWPHPYRTPCGTGTSTTQTSQLVSHSTEHAGLQQAKHQQDPPAQLVVALLGAHAMVANRPAGQASSLSIAITRHPLVASSPPSHTKAPPAMAAYPKLTGGRGTLGKELVPLDPFLNLLNCRGSSALRWLGDQPRSGRYRSYSNTSSSVTSPTLVGLRLLLLWLAVVGSMVHAVSSSCRRATSSTRSVLLVNWHRLRMRPWY